MSQAQKSSPFVFFKEHILPLLFIFLIPGFSAWFFNHAENWLDGLILKQIETNVQQDSTLTDQRRNEILAFYRTTPVSEIMASSKPEAVETQKIFESSSFEYTMFRWMKRFAWVCLGTIFATLLIVGGSVAFSLRSHSAQYYALRVGWPVLRYAPRPASRSWGRPFWSAPFRIGLRQSFSKSMSSS